MKDKIFRQGWVLMAIAAAVLWCAPLVAFAQDTQTGVVGVAHGMATVITEDGQEKVLNSGDPVYLQDKLTTGADGHLQILLLDETVLTIGPESSIKINEFMYDPSKDEGKVNAEILRGIFRIVSGKVAHQKPENMSVDLPAGTIGFRGTLVAGDVQGMRSLVILLGPSGGEGVMPGRIFVSNTVNGELTGVEIDQTGYGTVIEGPQSAPSPAFEVSEEELSRIAGALRRIPTPGGRLPQGASGVFPASGPDTDDMDQTLSLLSRLDDFNQKSMGGGTLTPPQAGIPGALPGGGRGDEDNSGGDLQRK